MSNCCDKVQGNSQLQMHANYKTVVCIQHQSKLSPSQGKSGMQKDILIENSCHRTQNLFWDI